VWKALKKKLANQIFEKIEGLEEALCEALKEFGSNLRC
jgi:hypothetical protein